MCIRIFGRLDRFNRNRQRAARRDNSPSMGGFQLARRARHFGPNMVSTQFPYIKVYCGLGLPSLSRRIIP